MRGLMIGVVVVAAVVIIALATGLIDIGMTGGDAPDVDVSVEGGEAPEVSATTGDVDVGTEEVQVDVPTVDVEEAPEADAEAEAEAQAEEQSEAAEEQVDEQN